MGSLDRFSLLDLTAVFLCCQAEGRAMLQRGSGSIINVVSISSHVVNRPQLHNCHQPKKPALKIDQPRQIEAP